LPDFLHDFFVMFRHQSGYDALGCGDARGIGVLVGKMIVGVTLAGYDAPPQNVTKLIALIRKENAATRAALAASGDQQRSAAATFRLVFGTKVPRVLSKTRKEPGMSASLRSDRSNAFTEHCYNRGVR
jgi:hypothetical protein